MSLNSSGNMSLGVSFSGDDVGLKSALDTIASSFDKMKQAGASARAEMKASYAEVKAGVGIIKAAYKEFQELNKFADQAAPLQKGLKELKIFSRASAEELEAVKQAALASGTVIRGFNADHAIEAMKIMAQVTGSAATATQLLNPALELAQLAQTDAAVAGESLARTIKKFGLEASEANRVNDLLVFGVREFGLLQRDIVPVLDTLNQAASRSKTSFEDTALAAFVMGAKFGDVKEGASAAASATKAFAESSNEKIRAFVRSGRDGTLSLLGAYEKLISRYPNGVVGLNQFRAAAAAAAGPQGAKALVDIHQGLQAVASKNNQTFKDGRAVLAALRGDMKGTAGQAAQMALGLVSAQSVTKNAWRNIWIAIADPLRTALKPIHEAFARISLAILDFVNSIPGPVKQAIANFVVFAVKVAAALGAFLALKAAVGLVLVAVKGLIPIIISAAATFITAFAPVIAQFLLAVAVFEAFREAYERDIGGFGTFVKETWAKVKLAWDGLMQVFSTGELSGAVLAELEKTKNKGVLEFIVWMYSAWGRLEAIVDGIKEGFYGALQPLAPLFDELRKSFSYLAEQFGLGSNSILASFGRIPFAMFKEFGQLIGNLAANVVSYLIKALIWLADLLGGIGAGVASAVRMLSSVFDGFKASALQLWDSIKSLLAPFQSLFATAGDGTPILQTVGKVVGWLAGAAFSLLVDILSDVFKVLGVVIDAVKYLITFFIDLGTTVGTIIGRIIQLVTVDLAKAWGEEGIVGVAKAMGRAIKDIFFTMIDAIIDRFDRLRIFVAKTVDRIPGSRKLLGNDFFLDAQLRESQLDQGFGAAARRREEASLPKLASPGVTATEEESVRFDRLQSTVQQSTAAISSQPLQANLLVSLDGQTIAEVTQRIQRENHLSEFPDN